MRARAHGVNVKNLAKSEENQLAGAVLAILESLAAQGVSSPSMGLVMGLAMGLERAAQGGRRCRCTPLPATLQAARIRTR
jgi:hypothetical protein